MEWPKDLKAWWELGVAEGAEGYHNLCLDAWWKMRSDFLEHGISLFDPLLKPPYSFRLPIDGLKSCPSQFVFEIVPDTLLHVQQVTPLVYPARLQDGTDAMIRIVAACEPSSELELLQFLSTPEMLSHADNHTLPIIQVLSLEKRHFKFVVFPRIGTHPCHPWFHHIDEALDCIGQTLEGVAFMHRHLIAHRDIAEDNILINHKSSRPRGKCPPFRSLYPVRYFFIDFEYAIRFPEDSDPSTRLVSRIKEISRFGAPETQSDTRYCPFAADVFNLGFFYFENFRQLDGDLVPIVDIFRDMLNHDPKQRITASDALTKFSALRDMLSPDTLQRPVPPRIIICGDDDAEGVRKFLEGRIGAPSRKRYGQISAP
ncbi:hypothetical protein BD410DRAFT_521319 [Rickenella mellea]|uniref:Protein kinase domain-containing protein n=1 Tax=Rickenella mellea TaxID=50990 RepID=A0A4Y7QHW7_9AGAM|nr:hypothetical protein BD410DRAFT_521319 [Rickenella mellea]